ncbi:sigma-70 family RNA polymerase sigma factor [Prevotella sp. oral taxon 376]|uniref:RNA polymerase sigma factor n=1 Tax=Prevotella sp. oral taxon 376 TaxID=712466 RepID=UPI000D1EAE60|nr:RNA polymerase sigma factor [Prevotella sp. oral taxon 376]PTL32935.1 sigma-70 family RNA polymerase sigma factor [Prevotella sp. oral taxon 376]
MEQREFEQIADSLRKKALQMSRNYQIPEESGEDIAQDTLLKLWLHRAEFSTAEDCQRLAGHIARHLCIDHFRSHRRLGILESLSIADEAYATPHDRLVGLETGQWLDARMQELPPKEYEILRLRQTEQKTNAEIAALLGIGKGSVATLLSKARKQLFEEIKRKDRYENR